MKKKSVLFFLILFLFSCSGNLQEKEPNNTLLEAQGLTLPFEVYGKMDHGLDEDYYVFEVAAAGVYSFEVESLKGFDLMLQVLDQGGKVLKSADDYYKNFGETIPNLYLNPGKFYLKISAGANDHKIGRPVVVSSNSYRVRGGNFSEFSSQPVANPEREPNDTFETAQEIKKGEMIEGYFYPFLNSHTRSPVLEKTLEQVREKIRKDLTGKELDIYYFSISEKGEFLLKMEVSPCQDFDPVLIVVSQEYIQTLGLSEEERTQISPENRGELFVVDSSGFDRGEGIANYKIRGNRKYFVILAALNRLNYEPLARAVQNPYSFRFEISPVTADLEAEPNDGFTTAQKIETNVLKGYLNPSQDKDFYVLENSLDTFYKLDFRENTVNPQITRVYKLAGMTLTPPGNLDLALDIYDSSYQLLKTIDNQGKGGIEEIPNLLLELNSRVYLVVRSGKTNDEDNYREPYELKIYFSEKESQDMEAEVNDEPSQNQGMNTFSDSVRGYVNTRGDADHFYLLVEDRGRAQFYLQGLPGATFTLELYDSSGFFVKKAVAAKPGENVSLEYFAPKRDVFRIRVSVMEKNFFNTQLSYSLSFSILPGP